MIGSVVHKCVVDVLEMNHCELSADEIEGFAEGVVNGKVNWNILCLCHSLHISMCGFSGGAAILSLPANSHDKLQLELDFEILRVSHISHIWSKHGIYYSSISEYYV